MLTCKPLFNRCLFALAAMSVSFFSYSQEVILDNSLLWKIEGSELDHPTYLFGTIHAISQDDFFMPESVEKAFSGSQQIVLELDMDDPQMGMQLMQGAVMSDGNTLDKLMEPAAYAILDSLIQKNTGVGAAMFNNWQPMLAFSLIVQEFIEGKMASYELAFVEMSKEAQKEILGLETVQEQINAIANITYQDQANYLHEQIMDLDNNRVLFKTMVDLYVNQKITDLEDYIVESNGGDELAVHLLKERNEKWIDRMIEMGAQKPTFFAVGAGHLAGENGVIHLLRKEGYSVTAVK